MELLEAREVPALVGNSLFPADNPWNQKISDAPVAANSATLVNSIGPTKNLHPDFGSGFGIPYTVVPGSQAKVDVIVDDYASESDIVPVPIPADVTIEAGGDRHVIVYDKDGNVTYELFGASMPSENVDGKWHAVQLSKWEMGSNYFRPPGDTSADAAGLPILPGLVRADEVFDQGVINHALRFTVPKSDREYVFPASHFAGTANDALPRMGERFRLRQDFDISGFSKPNQVILQALKDYGMVVADNGSSWFLSGAPDPRWNNANLSQLKGILGSNFEAVDLTPRVTGLGTQAGPAGTQVTINGQNFSGAAGTTKVYFGSVLASSVQVVSDTQIVATAPQGSSTVDVTVRSGYGKSAVSSVAAFTYSQVVVDAPTPAVATHFDVRTAAGATAGAAVSVTVTALDASNRPVTGYVGRVRFTSTDAAALLPADYTFSAADGGTRTFTATLQTAGAQTVTATAGTLTGSGNVNVTAPTPSAPSTVVARLKVVAAGDSTVAGAPLQVTVTALDADGNVVTNFAGTVRFTSNDGSAILPTDYTFTTADQGTRTFTVALHRAGEKSVIVTDTVSGLYGRDSFLVLPAQAVEAGPPVELVTVARLRVVAAGDSTVAGAPLQVTVTALDANGNVATGYRGTVRFTSNDGSAILPTEYTFTAADQGTRTFTVALHRAGEKSVIVTDLVNALYGRDSFLVEDVWVA